MQRVYGAACATKEDLKAYQTRLEEAAKRDHRKLGAEMDLFSFPDEIGPGLAVFHPKGAAVINAMEDYSREMHRKHHYSFVHTPKSPRADSSTRRVTCPTTRTRCSRPCSWTRNATLRATSPRRAQEYYLKAMNCPMHNLIFRSRGRSYRELPLRFYELGHDYRYEKSGVVHGLTRMRGFTQDDSHTYCTPEQASEEIHSPIEFFLSILSAFGLKDFYLELSTRDEDGKKTSSSARTRTGRPPPRLWRMRRRDWPRPRSAIRAVPPSTAPRSPCRSRTPSAVPGRCRRSSTTSTSLSASTWSTRPPTALVSAPS